MIGVLRLTTFDLSPSTSLLTCPLPFGSSPSIGLAASGWHWSTEPATVLVFTNCYHPNLAHPARRALFAWNDDAERPLAGWQRLAVLDVRQ